MRRTVICRPRMRFICMFNAQRSNVQRSTFNVQRPTFNAPMFPRFNVQPSHAQRPNLHPSPIVYRLSSIGYRLSAIVYRLSFIGYRLSAIGYQLSAIGYRLSAIVYDQPSTPLNTHPPAHVGAPDPHSSETQDRVAAPGSWRSGYRA